MGRIRITGYYTPEPDEVDDESELGITADADSSLFGDENGTGLKVSDLEDLDVTRVE